MCNKRKLSIVILAGGYGTRIRKSIGEIPKILAPIGNENFLFYLIKWINPLLENNNCQLVFSLFYKSNLIIDYLNNKNLDFKISLDKKPHGTFGAVCNSALQHPSEDYLILNGDTIFNCDFNKIYKQFLNDLNKPLLVLKKKIISDRYGGYINAKNDWFFSQKNSNAISMGAYFISNIELQRRWEKSTKLKFNLKNVKENNKIFMNDNDCLAIDPVRGYLLKENDFFIDIGIEESFLKGQLSIPTFFKDNYIYNQV